MRNVTTTAVTISVTLCAVEKAGDVSVGLAFSVTDKATVLSFFSEIITLYLLEEV